MEGCARPLAWTTDTLDRHSRRIGFVMVDPDGGQGRYAVPLDGNAPVHLAGIECQAPNAPFDGSPDGIRIATSDAVRPRDES
jgi:hypothetical protein